MQKRRLRDRWPGDSVITLGNVQKPTITALLSLPKQQD